MEKSPIEYLKVSVTVDPNGDWDAVMDTKLETVVIQGILRKMILDMDKRGSKVKFVNATIVDRRGDDRRRDGVA